MLECFHDPYFLGSALTLEIDFDETVFAKLLERNRIVATIRLPGDIWKDWDRFTYIRRSAGTLRGVPFCRCDMMLQVFLTHINEDGGKDIGSQTKEADDEINYGGLNLISISLLSLEH